GRTLTLPAEAFVLAFQDGTSLKASQLRAGDPVRTQLDAASDASRASDRVPGAQITLDLTDPAGHLAATWRAILRDGSHYIRQEITLNAQGADLPVKEIRLLELALPGAQVAGSVKGSPITAGTWFLGFEHPLSDSAVADGAARAFLTRELPLRSGAAFTCSSVIGTVPVGQLRRGFLAYVERERAHPYRPFLHYNSWYDLGYFNKYDEAGALAVIDAFGTELTTRRGVTLDSFLFDDGWDDPQTLWHFHSGFPQGFTNVKAAAERYGAAPGVWMSPWGGYGKPRQERIAAGQAQGFETNAGGFELSGPRYYDRFHAVCLDMMRTYGVNQFKFDGTGNAAHVFPGSVFDSDFDAMLALIADLRAEKPDLYVNLTTGTYPSPFFLRSCDSIWRGGEDHDFAGVGSWRQKWITYRDADTYAGVVKPGPLFPLNSLMLHGMIYARHAHNLDTDPGHDFRSEARAYFGTGTQLQEMYVTPALLGADDWDALAEAARWARVNARALVDSHWVGGDPAGLEPYGHAAWAPGKATLVLRNPSDRPQTLKLDVATAFELPADAPQRYRMRSPWREDAQAGTVDLRAGKSHKFKLRPFEVRTLETV
ncbi:MAG TPA: hypothetical protein VI160_06390, partial [Gemmatimonadales bacterium]